MQNLKIFNHAEFGQVRTVTKSGEIWFVGKDVADALGYSQTAKAIRDHVKDTHKGVSEMDTPGGRQSLVIIDEAGLYSLVMRAKTDAAERFQEWVTAEVLPSIRKTGGYITDAQERRLSIMERNVQIRRAKVLLAIGKASGNALYNTICQSKAAEFVAEEQILPLPRAERKTYSATEIGQMLGVSANRIGKLANKYELKTDAYGLWVYDKSAHCDKQVESFRYYDTAVDRFRELVGGAL